MNNTTQFRNEILLELDKFLKPLGYKLLKREFSWIRQVSTEQSFFIHLNFGLYEKSGEVFITPSVNLRSQLLSNLLIECGMIEAKSSSKHADFGKTLNLLATHSYHFRIEDNPKEVTNFIYKDILDYGLPYLEKIKDYEYVEKLLTSDNPKSWPVELRSLRARYLPLLLTILGREKEAVEVLLKMEEDIKGNDQIVPDFNNFKNWFLHRYINNIS